MIVPPFKIELLADIKAIEQYCEKVRGNLGNLSFSEKRKALEALRIKVMSGKESIRIQGNLAIVSSQSV